MLLRRTIIALAIAVYAMAACQQVSAGESQAPPKPVHRTRYEVTVWAIRPTIVRNPTSQEFREHTDDWVRLNGIDQKSDSDSDAKLLARLQEANPKYRFTEVEARRTRTIFADAPWDVPALPAGYSLTLKICGKEREQRIRAATRKTRSRDEAETFRRQLEQRLVVEEQGREMSDGERGDRGTGRASVRFGGTHFVAPESIVLVNPDLRFADVESGPRYLPTCVLLYRINPISQK